MTEVPTKTDFCNFNGRVKICQGGPPLWLMKLVKPAMVVQQPAACVDRFLGGIAPLGEHAQGKYCAHQANQHGDHPFDDQMGGNTANRHPQSHSYGSYF